MLCWRDKKIFPKREKKEKRETDADFKKKHDKLTKKGDRWEKRRGKKYTKNTEFSIPRCK